MRFAFVVCMLGCKTADEPPPKVKATLACDALDRQSCLDSDKCTLVKEAAGLDAAARAFPRASETCTLALVDGAVTCRFEEGDCEQQQVQTDESGCTARPCTYVPADGDGPPMCVDGGAA